MNLRVFTGRDRVTKAWIQEEIENREWVSTIKYNPAVLARAQGDLSAAQRLVEESLATVREIDDPSREATRLKFIGWIRLERGDPAAEDLTAAAQAFENCAAIRSKLGEKG